MKSHTLLATLAFLSITAAALALMREVWLRRGQGQHPIVLSSASVLGVAGDLP